MLKAESLITTIIVCIFLIFKSVTNLSCCSKILFTTGKFQDCTVEKPGREPKRMKKIFLGKADIIEDDDDDEYDAQDDDDDEDDDEHHNHNDYIEIDESDKPAAIVATKPMPHCPHE